mmetsp:Transcript_56024/g.154376  ORF Transcript_56024/g.154376 Transcript_56024/m.154376 type:complete len:156 (-) Transcript_56024:14-481(-)
MSKRPLEDGSGPPQSRPRAAPKDDSEEEEDGPTSIDFALLKEQNRQLAAALSDYKRRLSRKNAENSKLRRTSSDAATTTQAVLRQWDVLNSDLTSMCGKVGVVVADSSAGDEAEGAAEVKPEPLAGSPKGKGKATPLSPKAAAAAAAAAAPLRRP